jgi:hypothetical protein
MPFALPEYDQAFAHFVHTATGELARASSPLLADLPREPAVGGGSVVDQRGVGTLELEGEHIEFDITVNLDDVRQGAFESLLTELATASEELARQQVGLLIASMQKITDYSGNVVKGDGEINFETFYRALDGMDFSLTDEGELSMPTIVMHPDAYAKAQALPPLTPEQQERLDALKKRKHEEALARRRSRRLS